MGRAPEPLRPHDVDEVIARFEHAWRTDGAPPILADFLPETPSLRRGALIELIKVDLTNRWSRGIAPKRLTDYAEELPELAGLPLPADLIYREFRARDNRKPVDLAEYTAAYPGQAKQLTQLAEDGADAGRTMMAAPETDPTLAELRSGDVIDDFDLLTVLGNGAFAKVFLARQRSMQRLVALKISPNKGSEPQTLAQLDHDYIVRVFDQRPLRNRALRLLYMQYVAGGTLLDVLDHVRHTPVEQRSGRTLLDAVDAALLNRGEIRPSESAVRAELMALSWPDVIAWLGRRIAEALDYAWNCGVLHRDIKPANVLLTQDGVPKVADFNTSFGDTISGDSPVAYFGGSLAYMSPEQLAVIHPDKPTVAADLDTRSDLYSLAVVLWELLTGANPFHDASTAGSDRTALDGMLARRWQGRASLPYDELPPDCSTALRRVLVRALDPDRDKRWSRGADMAQHLEICLNPRARDLVDPPQFSWRRRARKLLLPIMVLAIGVPNALACAYGYVHLRALVGMQFPPPVRLQFDQFMATTYTLSYLVGVLITNLLIIPLWITSRRVRRRREHDPGTLAKARAAALQLPSRSVMLCFALWAIVGLLGPEVLRLLGHPLAPSAYLHYFLTQLICGGIATAYPYFFVAFYTVRTLYPLFVHEGGLDPADADVLRGLHRRSTYFLAAAAAVPLLAVVVATFISPALFPQVIVPLRILCLGGVLSFIGVYWLYRMLEKDIEALEHIAAHN